MCGYASVCVYVCVWGCVSRCPCGSARVVCARACVRACVHMWLCVCGSVCVWPCVCTHVALHVWLCVHMYVYTCGRACACTHAAVWACARVHGCACVHMWLCARMCVGVRVRAHVWARTCAQAGPPCHDHQNSRCPRCGTCKAPFRNTPFMTLSRFKCTEAQVSSAFMVAHPSQALRVLSLPLRGSSDSPAAPPPGSVPLHSTPNPRQPLISVSGVCPSPGHFF